MIGRSWLRVPVKTVLGARIVLNLVYSVWNVAVRLVGSRLKTWLVVVLLVRVSVIGLQLLRTGVLFVLTLIRLRTSSTWTMWLTSILGGVRLVSITVQSVRR